MRVREGAAGPLRSEASEAGERRGNAGQRVHFEALVAMADAGGGSGFEAESVDVSPEGMRLRTAYLPSVGEKLVCRFEQGGSEVVVEGEVIWRNEAARGGEFGVRFTDIDRATAEALRALCAPLTTRGSEGESSDGSSGAQRGTRVRLHIEGLGSPMKARVRGSETGEVLVGSSLEFLRVGRSLDLEDVDRGVRREAHIDDVTVEIEPGTNIPQLVVALRYADAEKKGSSAKAPPGKEGGLAAKVKAAAAAMASAPVAIARSEGTSEAPKSREESSKRLDEKRLDEKRLDEKSARSSLDSVSSAIAESASEDGSAQEMSEPIDDFDAEERRRGDKLRGIGTKAASASRAVAGKIGPTLSAMGEKTKGAFAGMMAAIQKKRATMAETTKKDAAPRRMTAPPPTGALRSEGRKLVRGENEGDEGPTSEAPRANKKAAVIGSAVGLVAVLALFGVARFIGMQRGQGAATAEGENATALALSSATPAGGAPAAGTMTAPAAAGTGPLTAEVPLFGATPLSTTEPVPPPAPPDASAAANGANAANANGAPTDPLAAAAAAAAGDGSQDPSADDGDDGDGDSARATSKKEWGTGGVRNPVVLKIKMDGPIEGLNGASGAMGFTISLPGRRSLSSASDLARKDKRLASLQVVNNAHGAEVTVQFKDGVPPYLAKAKGDRLEIALGTEGHKKVAAKGDHKKKKSSASKKKSSKPSKKK